MQNDKPRLGRGCKRILRNTAIVRSEASPLAETSQGNVADEPRSVMESTPGRNHDNMGPTNDRS